MAKIKVVGNACVVTSSRTTEEIELLEKYRPSALSLYETDDSGKKVEVFKVGIDYDTCDDCGSGDCGVIGKNGALFGGETRDEHGYATITTMIPSWVCGKAEVTEWVENMIGVGILRLNKVEAQFDAAIAEVQAERAACIETIEVE